jgi:hypothetical protein
MTLLGDEPFYWGILLIRFTPNDPRGSVRMRRVYGRGSMRAIGMPATSTGRLPVRVHVPFDRRRSPDRDGGPADAPGDRGAPRFHGLRPAVWFGVNRISSWGIISVALRPSRAGPSLLEYRSR